MGKRDEKMLAKIAALLGKDVDEVKEQQALYTEEEAILEAQSVLNYYEWRRELTKGAKETDAQFEQRCRVWRYKICEGCNLKFAYSYHYDGVKFCSLDCLQVGLERIGLRVTYGQPLMKRWGLRYPGLVPSSALQALESLPQFASAS